MFQLHTEEMEENRQSSSSEEFEKCCLCGTVTDVLKMLPISERKWYVSGAGQLCRKCCLEVYGTDDLRALSEME